jgi:hypothetical protein
MVPTTPLAYCDEKCEWYLIVRVRHKHNDGSTIARGGRKKGGQIERLRIEEREKGIKRLHD